MKGRWNLSHPFTEHCKQQEDDDTIMIQLPDSVMKPVKVQKALFFKVEKCILLYKHVAVLQSKQYFKYMQS